MRIQHLGNYIKQINVRNNELNLSESRLMGINLQKEFMPSVANVIGTDLSKYKVVQNNQFAFNPMHVGRDFKVPIGIWESDEPIIVSPAYTVFEIIDENILLKEYLKLIIQLPEFDRYAWFRTDSSVRGGLGWDEFCSSEIYIPDIEQQKKIIDIYKVFNDRISLLSSMNKILENIAQSLFKHWFVDFDFPNDDGNPYKLTGGKIVESEIGNMPAGWRVGTIGAIANVIDCLHSKKPNRCEAGKPLLQLNNIRDDGLLDMSDIFFISDSDYAKWISRCEASQWDCVITNVGRVAAVAQIPEGVNAALGRNMTCVRCKGDFPYPTYLLECLLSDTMRREIINKTDSGTIMDALNVKNIPKLRLLIPDKRIIEAFERIISPIRCDMALNLRETFSLASSRDTLLPKLMSGELSI